ncbi:OLC1v1013743C1 [Oldenlandia corymbosa var. corymbosa]|uniref:OLC1v1013743C1 n=1 Tax=Oldenlandia corymbosa var. corymbosa TaxID=529605 RepID=A0AAV1DZ11_OLDCO|nr:OLC1v1013743C1 [Oldenlandia corymbosa var. corymbosa]
MPGQGKTTLAKKVYKDPQVQYHFHRIAWCYVSNQCKAIELLKEIGRVLIGTNNASKLELADLVDWLRKSFKKKRYLIVMDDIWDVELWYQVKGSFPNDSNGSRILFTTRNHDLASGVDLHCISHRLRLFSKEESQELMEKKLFQGNGGAQAELLEISKLIASLCEGLPLAVALSSSILCRTERQPDLWFEVALNLKTHLASEGCGKVIELSYKYLQDHLKSCFLYLGSFPRGASICTSELKQLWIAEGFIKDDEMHCSEDLANEYLDNLVSQNLVVLVEKSSLGGIKKCNVHDLLYDFCLEKAKEENFLSWSEESLIMDSCKFTPRRCSQYRLSIRTDDPFIMEKSVCVRKELPTSQVHSYLWFHPTHTLNFWFAESFRVLKVLNLEQVYLECDRFPQLILFNIHLKYLVLNFGYRQIECIPWSIGNLWNLETLIVIAKQLDDPLPDSMWKMKRLRHVKLCRFRLGLWSEEFGENDSFMGNHIETLGELDLGLYDSKTTEFLRKLPNLKKLHCHIEDKERFRMWFSLFGSLTQLQSLFIDGDFYEPPSSVSPPPFNFSKNLKKLSLWGLYIPWSRMSMIAKVLPDLHVLKLANEACVGSRWNLEDGDFPKLKYLKLDHLNVEEMDASGCDDNPFPCLEQLFVKNCHKLKDIPSFFEEIYTLKTIQMIGSSCEANDSARRILSSQQEMGNNDLQVFILRESNSNTYRLSHVADNNLKLPDWRTNLLPDSRRRIRNKIMETLWRCVPFFCGSGELKEIKKIATKFEDKIYTVATSQEEYLRKISLKMLTMEENRTPHYIVP